MRSRILGCALLVLLFVWSSLCGAATQMTLKIKGAIYAEPPCLINQNAPINAPFGSLDINKIDGSYKTIRLEYSLDCSRAVNNELRLTVRGVGAGFFSSALSVPNHSDIGIVLKKDGEPFPINTWSDFEPQKKPVLEAVLIKRPGSELETGRFTSSATLIVDYR
ncbi:TPA: fimbrial protein [Pseudomonas aeruginosa]